MKHQNSEIVVDATNSILGRVASFVAKQALLGKSVVILNCNKTLITGRKEDIIGKYMRSRSRVGSSLKGPKIIKNPQRIMKRTVRGMLSHKQGRGRIALKRLMFYNSVPPEYENFEKISMSKLLKVKTINLEDLSKHM